MQGKLWMLRAIDQADPLRYGNRELLLDGDTASFLVDTCLAIPAGRERSIAAYLLWELGWWHALSRPMAEAIAAVVPAWISEVTSADVYGVRRLLGGLRSNFPDLHGAVSAQVQPEDVARLVGEHGNPGSGESWAICCPNSLMPKASTPRPGRLAFRTRSTSIALPHGFEAPTAPSASEAASSSCRTSPGSRRAQRQLSSPPWVPR